MKHFLKDPIIKTMLLDNTGDVKYESALNAQYGGTALLARVAIQGINIDDVEETVLEYGFGEGDHFLFVKADEVTDLQLGDKAINAKSTENLFFVDNYLDKDLKDSVKDYYAELAFKAVEKEGGGGGSRWLGDTQELMKKRFNGSISEEDFYLDLENKLRERGYIHYNLYEKIEANEHTEINKLGAEITKLSREEETILDAQRQFSAIKEIGYYFGCLVDDEITEEFLDSLYVSSVNEGVATIGIMEHDGDNNYRIDNLFTLNGENNLAEQFEQLLKKYEKWRDDLGEGIGKEFMILNQYAYDVTGYESGEWTDSRESIMVLGTEGEFNYVPDDLSWRELKEEHGYAEFNGRVDISDIAEKINEDLLESLRKYDENVVDDFLVEFYEEGLETLWNKDYEDFGTIHAQISAGLKELDLEGEITILARKGKDFLVYPAFHNDEEFASVDFEGSPILVTQKVTPDEVEKVMDMLNTIKQGFIETVAERASEALMERLVELSNESESDSYDDDEYDDEQDNVRTM